MLVNFSFSLFQCLIIRNIYIFDDCSATFHFADFVCKFKVITFVVYKKSCNWNSFISKPRTFHNAKTKRFRRKLPSLFENIHQLVNLKSIFSSEKNLPKRLSIFQPTVKLNPVWQWLTLLLSLQLWHINFSYVFAFHFHLI